MAKMAKGANMLTGTFTVPDVQQPNYSYTLSFGKTFAKYMYLIEMTEESKAALMASGQKDPKQFACYAIYRPPKMDNVSMSNYYMSCRINPSTSFTSLSCNVGPSLINGESMVVRVGAITGGSNVFYPGYSYNYLILEIPE